MNFRICRLTSAAIILKSLAILTGCGDLSSSLIANHVAKDRKAKAQQHWDSVRGEVKLQLAKQHLDAGRLDDAEKVLQQAVAIAPSESKCFLLMTRLRLEQGRLPEARDAITRAATLTSNDPEVSYFAGVVAQRYGDLEKAESCYEAASRQAPNVADYVMARAETLVSLDRPADALDLIEGRMRDFDSNAGARMLSARICRMLGLRGPAVAHCREALRLASDDRLLAAECGEILAWAGRYGEAISALVTLVDQKQAAQAPLPAATPSVRRCLARAYIELSRPSEAMDVLSPLLQDELDEAAAVLYVRAAIAENNLAAASDALQRIQKSAPVSAETLLLCSYVAFRRGSISEASGLADRVIRLNPNSVEAHCLRGRIAETAGQTENAREAFEKALSLDPMAPGAAIFLSQPDPSRRCEAASGTISFDPQSGLPQDHWSGGARP